MVQINFGNREVSCKVVFYGPGMSGKTTNLEVIHNKAPKETVGEMVSIATETDRTLYFDFLPLDLGQVAGMRTKFQLYTVPGQIYYNATRKLVLQGCDGVIFVADSNPDKMAENLESLNNLRENLAEMGLSIDDPEVQGFIPIVLQYNKRDLPNALSVADINVALNPRGWATHEACARDGKGVFATLKEISRLVIEKLNREHGPSRRRTGAGLPPVPSAPTPTPAHPTPSPLDSRPAGVAPSPQVAPVSPPRPAPPAAAPAPRPAALPAAARPMLPSAVARPPMASAPTPPAPFPATRQPAPPATPADKARAMHLNKPKPKPLEDGAAQPSPDFGRTDPRLKTYRQGGSSMLRTLMIVLLFMVIAIVLLVGLALFVPAIRALLPVGLQQKIEHWMGEDQPMPPTSTAPTSPRAN